MAEKSPILNHIKRIAMVNALLFLYFVSSSFSCFITLTVALLVVATDSPYETFNNLLACKCQEGKSPVEIVNSMFKTYRNFTIIQQIIGVIAIKVLIEVTWFIPVWILIIIVAEVFGVWPALEEMGIVAQLKQHHLKVHEGFVKFAEMIPKYKEN